LISALVWFLFCAASELANADSRLAIFVIEPILLEAVEPPSNEQSRIAQEALESLAIELQRLTLEGHELLIGSQPDAALDATQFGQADVVIQILPKVGNRGLIVESTLYDKASNSWAPLSRRIFALNEEAKLKDALRDAILPPIMIRVAELAVPVGRTVLFADCLFPITEPGSDSDLQHELRLVAGLFSEEYGTELYNSAGLEKQFSIARLVPTKDQKYFSWWCVNLEQPHLRWLQKNSITLFGYVYRSPGSGRTPELSLVIGRRDRQMPVDTVVINPGNRKPIVDHMIETIEGKLNGM